MLAFVITLSLVSGGFASILCPPEFNPLRTIHLPHPTSCSKFLTCVGTHPVEQDCPAGLQWNVQDSRCDYPGSPRCTRASDSEQSFNATAVASSVCLPQTYQCPLNSKPTEHVVFLKHRDCRKFYACVSTHPVELSCPPTLYWNSTSCVCDYEMEAECDEMMVRIEEDADEQEHSKQEEDAPQEADEEEHPLEEQDAAEDAPEDALEDALEDAPEDALEDALENAPENAPEDAPEDAPEETNQEQLEPEVNDNAEPSGLSRKRRETDSSNSSSNGTSTSNGSGSSGSDSSGSGSSGSGSSGSGSNGSGSSGSTVQSGADIRSVSSIVIVVATVIMSAL